MRTTTAFSAVRRRFVLALLALMLAVGGVGVTGELGPDEAMAVGVDGGTVAGNH